MTEQRSTASLERAEIRKTTANVRNSARDVRQSAENIEDRAAAECEADARTDHESTIGTAVGAALIPRKSLHCQF